MASSRESVSVPRPSRAPGVKAAHTLLLHDQMLGERLYIYACARFLVVGAIVLGAVAADRIVGIEGLDVNALFVVAGLLCAYNVAVAVLTRFARGLKPSLARRRLLVGMMHATITLDFIFLTVALWLVGGTKSPFRAFYILHVIIAGVLLSRIAAFLHALAGYLMFVALVLGEWAEVIPTHWPAGAVCACIGLDGRYVLTVLFVQGMLMAVSVFFLTGLTQVLRAGERELRKSRDELERLSRMQRDFLHIALHDLKSPVAAVTGLLDNLQSDVETPLTDKQAHWVSRAHLRLQELTTFLRDLQTLAELEPSRVADQFKAIDLKALLKQVVDENLDLAQMQMHTLALEIEDDVPPVRGIDRLLSEAVSNLVTNAIKYTPIGGNIVVRALSRAERVRIEVEDNGIGLAPEDRVHLFEEFVRIRRAESAVGNVSGSGLGLAIVKRVIEMHHGRIDVISEINTGSTFVIELPADGSATESR